MNDFFLLWFRLFSLSLSPCLYLAIKCYFLMLRVVKSTLNASMSLAFDLPSSFDWSHRSQEQHSRARGETAQRIDLDSTINSSISASCLARYQPAEMNFSLSLDNHYFSVQTSPYWTIICSCLFILAADLLVNIESMRDTTTPLTCCLWRGGETEFRPTPRPCRLKLLTPKCN